MLLRINADDFGLSPGVNSAILQMFLQQKLHSASLICGCQYFTSAVQIAKQNPNLQVGLHFNLTTGIASFLHQPNSLLVDKNNRFKKTTTKTRGFARATSPNYIVPTKQYYTSASR